jgi:clan AA aspartic protease
MGTFTEEITPENVLDRDDANRGYIKESEIRAVKVQAMPDTGAWTLVINEEVCQQLGLAIKGETTSTLADGTAAQYKITAPVKIQWKDRSTELPSVVIPDAKEVLLGALPLEAMDLIVDPVRKILAGARVSHPIFGMGTLRDQPLHVLY